MKHRYLEVTYRQGKAVAGYLYLPRDVGTTSARTEDAGQGLRVDYDQNDNPIGVELTAPSLATPDRLNELMQKFGQAPLHAREWAPLQAA